MIRRQAATERVHLLFRIVAVCTVVVAFGQVTLGGVVRVTGSGLGCPDWPLCHGRVIPPFDLTTLIEYSHRLSASALGVLVLSLAVMAWVYYRPRRWVLVSSILALALVVVAAVLGGAAVATELDWWVVLIHLGIAELVVACLVITSAAAWGAGKSPQKRIPRRRETDGFNLMVLATLVGAFILILSGSYMVGYGASSSCPTWPFCNGSLLPDGAAYAVHMGHRFTAAAVGVLIATTAVAAWRRRTERKELGLAAIAVTLIFGAQVLVGAATIWVGFASYMKAIHLSLATLVWIAVVFLAALVFLPQGIVLRRSAPGHRPVSQPQRLAS